MKSRLKLKFSLYLPGLRELGVLALTALAFAIPFQPALAQEYSVAQLLEQIEMLKLILAEFGIGVLQEETIEPPSAGSFLEGLGSIYAAIAGVAFQPSLAAARYVILR